MISHKHKCIFIHIPKTAGTSINAFFHPEKIFDNSVPDYDALYGWCPERKFYLQHATSKQLVETELITKDHWESYFKFAFVRNPWDRAYSDFLWFNKHSGASGTFIEYISESGKFRRIMRDNSTSDFRGDHIVPQIDYFDFSGKYSLDFLGRFENFKIDIATVLSKLKIKETFEIHSNKSTRKKDYSQFYTNSMKRFVESKYKMDIELLNYKFEDKRFGFSRLKRFL
jgi:chondroitin 4-sulfotransferase 11